MSEEKDKSGNNGPTVGRVYFRDGINAQAVQSSLPKAPPAAPPSKPSKQGKTE
jgi:hypothetical protein